MNGDIDVRSETELVFVDWLPFGVTIEDQGLNVEKLKRNLVEEDLGKD